MLDLRELYGEELARKIKPGWGEWIMAEAPTLAIAGVVLLLVIAIAVAAAKQASLRASQAPSGANEGRGQNAER